MFNVFTRQLYPNLLDKIIELEGFIQDIIYLREPAIDPSGKPVMPKVVWKLKTYVEITKHRVADFSIAVCNEWNMGNVGAAFVLVRCIYENQAYIFDILNQIESFIQNKDFNSCDDLIMNRLFGTKISQAGLPKIQNVLTVIDKLDKTIPGYRHHYDILSEFSHPNYWAMAQLYCKFHEKPYVHSEISSACGVNENNLDFLINSMIPSFMAFKDFLKSIDQIYPELTKLSNEDEDKGRDALDKT